MITPFHVTFELALAFVDHLNVLLPDTLPSKGRVANSAPKGLQLSVHGVDVLVCRSKCSTIPQKYSAIPGHTISYSICGRER
jgi:hypothetical protein